MGNKSNIQPELLAPAQDWNTLKIVRGLTDAVYFGVENYNMRVKARNFKQEELSKSTRHNLQSHS